MESSVRYFRSQGFTLIELMVTVAIAAVLAAIAIPSYQSIVENNRLTSQANEMIHSFRYARSEAIKRGGFVRVEANNETDWGQGWNVVLDDNADGKFTSTTNLMVSEPRSGSSTTQTNGSTSSIASFEFSAKGILMPLGTSLTFTITPLDCERNQARVVTIEPSGLSSVAKQDCSS